MIDATLEDIAKTVYDVWFKNEPGMAFPEWECASSGTQERTVSVAMALRHRMNTGQTITPRDFYELWHEGMVGAPSWWQASDRLRFKSVLGSLLMEWLAL